MVCVVMCDVFDVCVCGVWFSFVRCFSCECVCGVWRSVFEVFNMCMFVVCGVVFVKCWVCVYECVCCVV